MQKTVRYSLQKTICLAVALGKTLGIVLLLCLGLLTPSMVMAELCYSRDIQAIKSMASKADQLLLAEIKSISSHPCQTQSDAFCEQHLIQIKPIKHWKGQQQTITLWLTTGFGRFDFSLEKGEQYILYLVKSSSRSGHYLPSCQYAFNELADKKKIEQLNRLFPAATAN